MKLAVTGAFGYSGRYIAQHLLEEGHEVLTLTNSVHRQNPFGGRVRACPYHFDEPHLLAESLRGVDTLINTYWVRFDHQLFTHEEAVRNTRVLFHAAEQAGVGRIVHVSITNPDRASALPYFRGKAELEVELQGLGISHCILRPAVLFGREDVLVNNIAWSLRHLPAFGVFGSGEYRLQPIYVDDLAAAAVSKIRQGPNEIVNAIGPEVFTYRGLAETVRDTLGLRRPILGVPPGFGYWFGRLLGFWMRDIVLTREEIRGLMEERLYVDAAPLGETKLSEWIQQHRGTLGLRYVSEMARRRDRVSAYRSN